MPTTRLAAPDTTAVAEVGDKESEAWLKSEP